MEVHVFKTPELAAKACATLIAAEILRKPDAVLGLPTGASPIGAYRQLVGMYREGLIDFSRVITFNLDEYMGLDGAHPQSYRFFMDTNLFNHVNIPREQTHVPSGLGDGSVNAREYERAISRAGGIDLQFMGIGRNGHIGFNEPDAAFSDATGVVNLTESTIDANTRFFSSADEVPRQAISMGVGTILRARKALLIATGADKADAVAGMINGPVTPALPASALRMHPCAMIVLDEEAAKNLQLQKG